MKRNWLQIALISFMLLWAAGAFGQTAHTAQWTINTNQCTTTATCTAQIWRVVIAANGTCPGVGDAAYINVKSALAGTFVDATQTTWQYTDSGPSLVSGSVYCGYATYTNSAGVVSPASAIFSGQIPTPLTAPGISVTLK